MNDDYWGFLDRLIAEHRVVIDRPKGSAHPRFSDMIYPLDYGYLEGTASQDGGGIDAWLGACGEHWLSDILVTVDLEKRDSEIKLMLGCTEEEIQTALNFLNQSKMRAMRVHRPVDTRSNP